MSRIPPRSGRLVVIAAAAVSVVVLVVAGIWFGQRSLLNFPDKTDPGSVAAINPRARDVVVQGVDQGDGVGGVDLAAWLVPSPRPRHGVVLYLAGNGANRAARLGLGSDLAEQGYDVLLLDYRGYGGNDGSPSLAGLQSDALAAREWLLRNGYRQDEMVYFGESLGTGLAVDLAVAHPPAAGVLRSPYTRISDVAKHLLHGAPVGWLVRDDFNSIADMPRLSSALIVFAGGQDDLVPAAQSSVLCAAAPSLLSCEVDADRGHNDPYWFSAAFAKRVAGKLTAKKAES